MYGKIENYDEESGIGQILAEDQQIYSLIAKNWRDYSQEPKSCLEVKFIPNSKELVALQVKVISEDEKSNLSFISENSKAKSVDEDNNKCVNIRYFDNINLDDFKDLPSIEYIPIERSFLGVYETFYEEAIEYSADKSLENYKYSYDYTLMRDFILTTYNNLKDRDANFMKSSEKNKLEKLYEIYKNLSSNVDNIKVFFDKAFLKNQKIYTKVQEIFKYNINVSNTLDEQSKKLDGYIKKQSTAFAKARKNSSEYIELDEKIKKARSNYVVCIDKLGILKKENEHYSKIMREFNEKYEENFLSFFEENTKRLLNIITDQMNKNAYYFDTIIWKNAKNSKSIRAYFINSRIEGSFSSRTYVEYFLKNLDPNSSNEKIVELKKLFNYIDSKYTRTMHIIDSRSNVSENLKFSLNHLSKFFKTKTYNYKDAILNMSEIGSECFLVYIENSDQRELDFIKNLKSVYPNAKMVLLGEDIKEKFVQMAVRLGYRNILNAKSSDKLLLEKISNIILDKEELEITKWT
jgi:hypothetical protein